MNEAESQIVFELFHEVAELTSEQRQRVYAARRVSDAVRDEVEALLTEPTLPGMTEDALESVARRIAEEPAPLGPTVDWSAGTKVGDYEIVREIARGGMGVVFEAQQRSLDRRVAIKVIRSHGLADTADKKRFRAEAEAIARLEHTGIVPVYEVSEHEGLQYFTMAYLPGGSLSELDVPLDPHDAAQLLLPICEAVHYAHTRNIVHRDLKPANVLLSESLQPRVSDFGLAKDTSEDSNLTHSGAILGTPGFMAPEQASGDDAGHLADVYGLGGVLFYLLTGRPPIEGSNVVDTLHKVLHSDPPNVRSLAPKVPLDLASITRRALEKAPLARYGSAAAMADDLRRFLAGEPTQARPLSGGARLVRWGRRRPALAAMTLIAILAVLGGAGVATWFGLDASEKAAALEQTNKELAGRNQELEASRDAERDAKADAEAFSTFLTEDVLMAARPRGAGNGLGIGASVRDVLLAALPRIAKRFEGRPLAEAEARMSVGVTLRHARALKEACEQLRLAHGLLEKELGPHASETLSCLNSYGAACYAKEDYATAIPIYEQLVELCAKHLPELQFRVLMNLAANYERVRRFADQAATLSRALEVSSGEDRLYAMAGLAVAHALLGDRPKARQVMREVRQAKAGKRIPDLVAFRIDQKLSVCLQAMRDDAALMKFWPEHVRDSRRLLGPTAFATVGLSDLLSKMYERHGRFLEAATELGTLVRDLGEAQGEEHRHRLARFARVLIKIKRFRGASLIAMHCSAIWRRLAPQDLHAYRADILVMRTLALLGQAAEGRQRLQKRIAGLRKRVAESKRRPKGKRKNHNRWVRTLAEFEQLLKKKG